MSNVSLIVKKLFQSTHPRGVRLPCGKCVQCLQKFQSTHPRGVRRCINRNNLGFTSFQSTHPRGVRRTAPRSSFEHRFVSIHAPTRGATVGLLHRKVASKGFNPRTHEGCDRTCSRAVYILGSFNPRTHEGCDVLFLAFQATSLSFNPRTHEGCDRYC